MAYYVYYTSLYLSIIYIIHCNIIVICINTVDYKFTWFSFFSNRAVFLSNTEYIFPYQMEELMI